MTSIRGTAKTISTFNDKLRDAFQEFPGRNWDFLSRSDGDLFFIDGNACGSSYLVVSLDPLSAGSSSWIETDKSFTMPSEVALGLHFSQRTLGQEFCVEFVSTEPVAMFADLSVSSIQQSATTLTVDTMEPHGLRVGSRIGIANCTDVRLNYPSLVVATTPTPSRFTATAGPGGTIPSLTAGPLTAGIVYHRPAMGGARNGLSLVFENATATNASMYIKAEGGDATPIGGAIAGNHSVTVGSTSSVQAANAALNYSFRPSTEFRSVIMADRVQVFDSGVDAVGAATGRANITQICPNPDLTYKLRIRAENNKSLTTPTAQIVSASKSGTTTATVVTATPHGLTVGDLVQIFGTRDQTNFASITTPTAVASVVNSTSFTIVWGSAVTATTYGGIACRPNGGLNLQGVVSNSNVQSVTRTSNVLTVVTGAAVTGLLIGDLINLVGVRVDGTGAPLGVDGSYRVRDIQTTSVFLEPVGTAPTGTDITTTNCGGMMIRRTDLRLSYLRLFDFERARVEFLPRGSDQASSLQVLVSNPQTTVALNTGTNNVGYVGLQGPQPVADIASAAITSTTTTAAITPAFGASYEVNIPVTALSGTVPVMDFSIEESDDAGTNWFKVYDFPRISATGIYRSPKLTMVGTRIRYVQTIAGTTPSITRSVNRLQYSDAGLPVRQLIDRSFNSNVLNTTTASLNVQPCNTVQLVVTLAAASSPPTYRIEGSDDNGLNWYPIGAALPGVANTTVELTVPDVHAALVRARVSVAGGAVVSTIATLKGF